MKSLLKEWESTHETNENAFVPKSASNVEEACLNYFEQTDLETLPLSVSELKARPPHAINPTLENVIIRAGSFQVLLTPPPSRKL